MHDLELSHLEDLMPRLRARDVAEILEASRYTSIADWARSRAAGPGIAWAMEIDGQIEVAGGLLQGPVDGIGVAWLVGTERIRRAARALLRMWRLIVVHGGYRRIECRCFTLNAAANRFAEKLGFQYEGTLRAYTLRGNDVNVYGMVPHGR